LRKLLIMDINKALKEARIKSGLTQTQTSEKSGLTQTYISQIEGGHKNPSMETIQTLSDTYKIPVAIIMWQAIDVKDVQPHKRQVYSTLKPTIDDMINRIF
jgi:transcriptional regulator with XRE-family HTH domain